MLADVAGCVLKVVVVVSSSRRLVVRPKASAAGAVGSMAA
jgi:hypothetical protein